MKLVGTHEELTLAKGQNSKEVLSLTNETNSLKEQLHEKKHLIVQFQQRMNDKEQEIIHLQHQLEGRDKLHLENERNFLRDIRNREDANKDVVKRMQ